MALRFFTDFDEPVNDFTRLTGGSTWTGDLTDSGDWSTSWGEGGSGGFRTGDSVGNINWNADVANLGVGNTTIFGCRIRMAGYGSTNGGYNDPLFVFGHTGGTSCSMRRLSSTWEYRDQAGTIVGTGGPLLATGSFQTVEIKIVQGNGGAGSLEVRFDGVTVFSDTTGDYRPGGDDNPTPLNSVTFPSTNTYDHDNVYFDRIWVADGSGTYNNDFFGNITAEYKAPTGNGNSSDWVGSDGNSTDNYLLVDEDPMSMTDYIRGSTQGDIDLFTHASGSTDGGIIAVNPIYMTDFPNGGGRSLRPVTRISATNYTGTSLAAKDGGQLAWTHFLEEDPSTSSAWTASAVNSAEFGVEVRDDNG